MSYPIEGVVKPTILVVDDTPDNLSLMRELLRKDYQVQLANGGERALKLAAMQPQPDLILLDIMMPVMDGYEVCRRLKSDVATRDIPVVFLTAKADVEDEKRGAVTGGGGLHHQAHQPAGGAGAGQDPSGTQGPCRLFARQERFLGSRGE